MKQRREDTISYNWISLILWPDLSSMSADDRAWEKVSIVSYSSSNATILNYSMPYVVVV